MSVASEDPVDHEIDETEEPEPEPDAHVDHDIGDEDD